MLRFPLTASPGLAGTASSRDKRSEQMVAIFSCLAVKRLDNSDNGRLEIGGMKLSGHPGNQNQPVILMAGFYFFGRRIQSPNV
jgi:hypothetical protein